MRHESIFEASEAFGHDLAFNDCVDVSGCLSQAQLRKFAKARRTSSMGPTTIYYSGVTAPAVSAGMAAVTYSTLMSINWPQNWSMLASAILAAMAGISWYLVFMRLGSRGGFGRNNETTQETRVIVDERGVEVMRGEVRTIVGWKAVEDITICKSYIALILDGANDVLLPVGWFGDEKAMKDAARKMSALRPPPFAD